MGLSEVRIVIDERERKSGIPGLLRSAGLRTEMRTLQVGDYVVAPETVVERKSIPDLLSSVFDGRLFDQCGRLREHYEHPVILVEGNADDVADLVENPLVFYGALSTVALEFRIPIIPTPSADHTAKLLAAMCARRGSPAGPFVKKIRKTADVQQQQLALLSSMPGVGQKLASRMLERFGTPRAVMASTLADLSKVRGLGAARARKIRTMLDSESRHSRPAADQRTLGDA